MSRNTNNQTQCVKKQEYTNKNKFIKNGGRSNALTDFSIALKWAAKKLPKEEL